jgi:DNA-binding IclR family transcriptional regulator
LDAGLPPATEFSLTNRDELIADLSRTAVRGYSIDNQENLIGIRCVGAPIFDRRGNPVASLSVSALAVRMTDETIERTANLLLLTTGAISAKLGYTRRRAEDVNTWGTSHVMGGVGVLVQDGELR